MECKENYRGLTVRLKLDGTEELGGLLETAKELEATLERVTSLIERISLARNADESSIGEVSKRLYELERKTPKLTVPTTG